MVQCTIKYINVAKGQGKKFCELVDFEEAARPICHETFEEMCAAVKRECPEPFVCVEPIAFYHEVMWDANGACRDVLRHAIEAAEYDCVCWDAHKSLCVDVVRAEELTSFGRRFPEHLAGP